MSSKRQTTMAKLQRERRVEERRTLKREKKQAAAAARKAGVDLPQEFDGEVSPEIDGDQAPLTHIKRWRQPHLRIFRFLMPPLAMQLPRSKMLCRKPRQTHCLTMLHCGKLFQNHTTR